MRRLIGRGARRPKNSDEDAALSIALGLVAALQERQRVCLERLSRSKVVGLDVYLR